jgi:hypothetical protein
MKTVTKKRSLGLETWGLPLVVLENVVLLSRHVVFVNYVLFVIVHVIST